MSPDFDRRRDQLEQSLADQGLDPASEAYRSEIEFFERGRNNALADLALGSVAAGGNEQSRMFGLASTARGQQFGERLSSGNFRNDALQNMFTNEINRTNTNNQWAQNQFQNEMARTAQNNASLQSMFDNDAFRTGQNNASMQQLFANELTGANFNNQTTQTERALGFNELSNLMGATPSMPLPSFGAPTPIDVMGPAIADANSRRSSGGGGAGVLGLFGSLGSAALGNTALFSSREYKTPGVAVDEAAILQGLRKLPVERWKYKGESTPHIGTFAEDFNKTFGTGMAAPRQISVVDAVGVMMASIQALADQNEKILRRLDAMGRKMAGPTFHRLSFQQPGGVPMNVPRILPENFGRDQAMSGALSSMGKQFAAALEKRQDAQLKRERAQGLTSAMEALTGGLSGEPWLNPDTGQMVPTAGDPNAGFGDAFARALSFVDGDPTGTAQVMNVGLPMQREETKRLAKKAADEKTMQAYQDIVSSVSGPRAGGNPVPEHVLTLANSAVGSGSVDAAKFGIEALKPYMDPAKPPKMVTVKDPGTGKPRLMPENDAYALGIPIWSEASETRQASADVRNQQSGPSGHGSLRRLTAASTPRQP